MLVLLLTDARTYIICKCYFVTCECMLGSLSLVLFMFTHICAEAAAVVAGIYCEVDRQYGDCCTLTEIVWQADDRLRREMMM